MDFAKIIDHTMLKADSTRETIQRYCAEAKQYGFASVCVNSCHAALVARELKGTGINTCCVVGFPLGAMITEAKAFEAKAAVAAGADEVDMVINIGAIKDQDMAFVEQDIKAVVEAAKPAIVKVIIETCLLTEEEKVLACELSKAAGADFVKTSTGFSTAGATTQDIALMRKTVGPELGVKAAGGVRTRETAEAMIAAGATRIGASSSRAILEG